MILSKNMGELKELLDITRDLRTEEFVLDSPRIYKSEK